MVNFYPSEGTYREIYDSIAPFCRNISWANSFVNVHPKAKAEKAVKNNKFRTTLMTYLKVGCCHRELYNALVDQVEARSGRTERKT